MSTRFLDPATDAAAIRRSLADPHAFTAVFDRHFDAVHGYAQRRAGGDLADEIAAETFVRAFDLRERYDLDRPDARPWLLGIASNLLRRHWRTERRQLAAYHRAREPQQSHVDPNLVDDVLDVLDSVPERDREALLLLAWADLSYDEIAIALDVPLGTVRSRISRARHRLRQLLRVDDGSGLHLDPSASKESSHA